MKSAGAWNFAILAAMFSLSAVLAVAIAVSGGTGSSVAAGKQTAAVPRVFGATPAPPTPTPTATPSTAPTPHVLAATPAPMGPVSIDMSISGNTASSLGTRENCAEAVPGQTIILDVTAEGIPAYTEGDPNNPFDNGGGAMYYTYLVSYDEAALTIESEDANFLLAQNPTSFVTQLSDPTPDVNGDNRWKSEIFDTRGPSYNVPEGGSGVLSRIAVSVTPSASAGYYRLRLSDAVVLDGGNTIWTVPAINDAMLALSVSCSDAPAVTPTAIPAGPTPTTTSAPPTLTPTATPIPGSGRMDAMSIDLDVTGNTATNLGPRDSCLQVSPGESVTLDVSAEGIPASNPMVGFTFALGYQAPLTLDSYNVNFLIGSLPGSRVLDPGPGFGSDRINISGADTGPPSSAESGTGVLARVSLLLGPEIGPGAYSLFLESQSGHIDTRNNPYNPVMINNALVVVGGSCDDPPPMIPPAPTPTRTATPVPVAPTTTPTPRPATATPSPLPTPIRPAECPASPEYDFTVTDPVGDQRNYQDPNDPRDILSIRGFGNAETFCLTVTVADTVDLASSDTPSHVWLGFDTDLDGSTGPVFGETQLGRPRSSNDYRFQKCSQPGFIGAEAILILPSSQIAATYAGSSVTAEIPISEIGGDSSFDLEVILDRTGKRVEEASDCAPNGASINSPEGLVIPPRDRDGDGAIDARDNCPHIAGTQQDTDYDGVGDVCDESPTHGFEIRRFRGYSSSLNLEKSSETSIRWKLVAKNLYPWDSVLSYDIGRLQGLPDTCQVDHPYLTRMQMAPLAQVTIQWEHIVTCGPNTPQGDFTLTLDVRTYYLAYYGVRLGLDESTATATLRVR